jgi:hypothetical protein
LVEMGRAHTLVVYRASARADASLREAARAARRSGGRLSVVALAPVERQSQARCCDMRSVMWNGIQRELADADLAKARLAVDDDPAVDLRVLPYEGLGAGEAVARHAADTGVQRIVLADARTAGLGRWARRRLRRRSTVPVSD